MIKTQKGGKYLGSGTFGCVISPNIKCQNKAQYKNVGIEDKNLISKLSTYKYYDSENLETVYDEINIGKRVYKIDRDGIYLCPIIHHCRVKLEDVETRTDLKTKNIENMDEVDLEYKKKDMKRDVFSILMKNM